MELKLINTDLVKLDLSDRINTLKDNVYAENTVKAYNFDIKLFQYFCLEYSLPENENSFFLYLTALSNTHSYNSIERKASSINHIIKADPYNLKQFLRSTKRTLLNEGKWTKQASAILLTDLEFLINQIDCSTLPGLRNKTMMLLMFFGAFRISELLALRFEDIKIDSDGLVINIERSKTDQFGKGMYKYIPLRSKLCAYSAFLSYLSFFEQKTGLICRQIKKGSKVQDNAISYQAFNKILKTLDYRLSSHSFRAGFVTQCAINGASISDIQNQTGQKSANTVLRYTRTISIKNNNSVNNL